MTDLLPDGTPIEHRFVDLPDVRLHVAMAGEPGAPLVVLLHGFPEFWYSWRHQLGHLARRGYRVAAPDLRGYNLSSKPHGVSAYRIAPLAQDVASLIEQLAQLDGSHVGVGEQARAHVVGHDWGGAVAWAVAARHPNHVQRLAVLNCPHPVVFRRALTTRAQLRRSAYMFFFQLDGVAERKIQSDDCAAVRRMFRKEPQRAGAFTEAEIDRYVEALAQPGALTAALSYYRAAFRYDALQLGKLLPKIDCPTLVVHGTGDRHIGAEWAQPDASLVRDAKVVRLPGVSHWVQVDAHARVNDLLTEFFAEA